MPEHSSEPKTPVNPPAAMPSIAQACGCARPTVLFVDDEPSVTSSIRRALAKHPFEVLTASSGEAGLQALESTSVCAVVSDFRMPEMTGTEFLREVRQRYPAAARLMLTGEADMRAAASAINDAGVHRLLLKPCPATELALAIQDVVRELSRAEPKGPGLAVAAHVQRETLEQALDQLWLAFQPIVRSSDNLVCAYECLMRSHSASLPTPDLILGAAAALGELERVDLAVWHKVAAVFEQRLTSLDLWVNVCPESLALSELDAVDGPLLRHSDRIVLEITEASEFRLDERNLRRCRELRQLGYRIALDDLGAGYAGLNALAAVVPDFVKYDRGLVSGVDHSPSKLAVVRSMNAAARDLGILTLAEGIESESESATASALGCNLMQGYWFGRPGPLPASR
jgi:EAL domain-containing protein (putative c-di-GMP-specific phosphodiesterase class I)/CheY-like chemotaxis protein